mmetsp:Transcript_23871/g.73962  ORF Transcript_23871/g.73962 Transcript_23871/m.73962 type:complete len:219 (+) Transcript_23871:32-688(+)
MKPGSASVWRRITAGCGSSIAHAHTNAPRFGHLVELPPERPLESHVSGASADEDARKAVRERMHRYYHSITIANGVTAKNVTSLCARWRLDCADSPTASDIVRAPSAKAMDETLRCDPQASPYSAKDVRALQCFDRGSGNAAAHRAACQSMIASAKEAASYFSHSRRARGHQTPQHRGKSSVPACIPSSTPRSRSTSARSPSDVESKFNELLDSLGLD